MNFVLRRLSTLATFIALCTVPHIAAGGTETTLWEGRTGAVGEKIKAGQATAGSPSHLAATPADSLTATFFEGEPTEGFPSSGWHLVYNASSGSSQEGMFYSMSLSDNAWNYDGVFILRFNALANGGPRSIDFFLAAEQPWENAGGLRVKGPRLTDGLPTRMAVVLNRLSQRVTLDSYGNIPIDGRSLTLLQDTGSGWEAVNSAALVGDAPITGFRLLFLAGGAMHELHLADLQISEWTP